MIDISKISRNYLIRKLYDSDSESIVELCKDNMQFYKYCELKPTKEQILHDLHITPPGIDISSKYYIGFYQKDVLVAVMDLIDGYPKQDFAFIGFFMMNKDFQGKKIGTAIISELTIYLKVIGKTAIRLAINKDNPQSNHFWKKNGFNVIKEVNRNGELILIAEKKL